MITVIYIASIEKGDFSFGRKVPSLLKARFPKCNFFDFDNYSDTTICQHAMDLAEQSEHVLVLAEVEQSDNIQTFFPFCNKLLRKNKEIPVVLLGEEASLKKMLKAVGKSRFIQVSSEDELMDNASTVLNSMTKGF